GMISASGQKSRALSLLETKINRGELKGPILALLEIERAQIGAGWFGMSIEMTMMAVMVVLVLGLVGSVSFLSYAYPAYNFCWGDYTETYKRRKVVGNTVFSAVVLALVIGVAANYISRFIP